jgi:hypothetical protein
LNSANFYTEHFMSNCWEPSAQAWIASMGERGDRGDWGREHVLDPVMLSRVAAGRFGRALDVGPRT